MKYWLDTEFIEDGRTIDLVSIAIVAEDGREFYAQMLDGWNGLRASDWVKENVLPHLQHPQCRDLWRNDHACIQQDGTFCPWLDRAFVARSLKRFCQPDEFGKPEFWAYFADYDWVALCQLFGTMMDLPTGWPKYCRDIKQWCDDLGNPRLPEQGKGEHHALADARWNRTAWDFLASIPGAAGAGR